MGLAASQARLLQLTRTGNNVRCELTRLSMQKMALTRETDKISAQHEEALRTKALKWCDNSGNYVNLTYQNLMYPNNVNQNKPYMITDRSGSIVVDQKYKEYAEMLSSDGSPSTWGGDTRLQILSQLTGVSAQDIDNAENYYNDYLDCKEALSTIESLKPNKDAFTVKNNHATRDLLQKLGSYGGISDWSTAYGDETQTISKSDIPNVVNYIKNNLGKYFMDDKEKFEAACDNVIQWSTPQDSIKVADLIDKIIGHYSAQGGTFGPETAADPNTGNTHPLWYDIDSPAYQQYVQQYNEWQTEKEQAEEYMETALQLYNQIFTPEIKTQIAFYNELFQGIADKGWVYNDAVTDRNYLNQMLLNNMYYITNATTGLDINGREHKVYDTDAAINYLQVAQVSDTEVRDADIIKYENLKNKINKKETAIDIRMEKLKEQQSAIQRMIDSITKIKDDNIQNNYTTFSA